jgi:hypothetical protein
MCIFEKKKKNYVASLISLRIKIIMSRDSTVDIATGYGLETEVSELSPGRVKNFLFFTACRLFLRPTKSPIQLVPGALSPEDKAAEA